MKKFKKKQTAHLLSDAKLQAKDKIYKKSIETKNILSLMAAITRQSKKLLRINLTPLKFSFFLQINARRFYALECCNCSLFCAVEKND